MINDSVKHASLGCSCLNDLWLQYYWAVSMCAMLNCISYRNKVASQTVVECYISPILHCRYVISDLFIICVCDITVVWWSVHYDITWSIVLLSCCYGIGEFLIFSTTSKHEQCVGRSLSLFMHLEISFILKTYEIYVWKHVIWSPITDQLLTCSFYNIFIECSSIHLS